MKLNRHILFLSLMGMVACSDDEAPAFLPTLPTNGGSPVTEIIHNGNLPDCCDWNLTYSGGRLVSAVGSSYINGNTLSSTFYLGFGSQSVSMRGNDGTQYTVDLNSDLLISRITAGNDTYEFSYRNNRLSSWSKTTVDDSFAPIPKYTSSATLTYSNGDLSKIVYTENENNPDNTVTLTFTADNFPNLNGLLPDGVTREFGCLGFEFLYYAGLMGSATTHLVQSVSASYALYPDRDYTLEYEYSTDATGLNVVLCNYRYEGSPASVTYKY